MNYDMPLYRFHTSCPWINWASVLMGLKLSSYLENFQPVIMKFCSLFSFFHFLWDSIYIYFSILKVVSNFCDAQLIFPTVFSSLFSMSLFNILNILQLHEYKDYWCSKHFNALPFKLCHIYFTCIFTNWFFPHYGYFLSSLHIWNFFFFLNLIVCLNQNIITLQHWDETRTNTFTIYMEILNWIVDVVTLPLDAGFFFLIFKVFLSLFANTVNFLETTALFEGLL